MNCFNIIVHISGNHKKTRTNISNIHRFPLSAIRGELLKRKRGRQFWDIIHVLPIIHSKDQERERERERDRKGERKQRGKRGKERGKREERERNEREREREREIKKEREKRERGRERERVSS